MNPGWLGPQRCAQGFGCYPAKDAFDPLVCAEDDSANCPGRSVWDRETSWFAQIVKASRPAAPNLVQQGGCQIGELLIDFVQFLLAVAQKRFGDGIVAIGKLDQLRYIHESHHAFKARI